MTDRSLKAMPYVPTSPRTGENGASIFRGQSMILKGKPPLFYSEIYGGSLDLSETIPYGTLSGTLTTIVDDKVIVGVGTNFLSEMRIGQWVFAGDDLLVVDQVTSQTTFVAARAPSATQAGLSGYLLPVLFAVNQFRGSLVRGNVRQFDKGNLLGVGDGTLRLNGSPISASFSATRQATLAVYDPNAGTYSIYPLGMDTPATPTAAEVAGGVKNMQPGSYGVILVPSREATNGFNNGSEPADVQINTAGFQIQVSSPAMDTANGQSAWDAYGTLYSQQASVVQGPWYFVKTVTAETLGTFGATTFNVEWRDAEISRNALLTFDNDPPVDSEFIGLLTGTPIYVSCQGQGYSSVVKATSPGPIVVPSKPNNIEAAPLAGAVPLSPPETIIGFCEAMARLFLLTPNHLQFAQFTGIPAFPVTARSYWKTGFKNPYQVIFDNDMLYGYPISGPTRSVADATEANEEHRFAAGIREIIKNWVPNHVMVAKDPVNNAICFFHAADSLNEAGFWTTMVLMFMLDIDDWSTPVVLSSDDHDMIVSGVATVGENLEFLAGGRNGSGIQVDTFRFDAGAEETDWYLAWQLDDADQEFRPKNVKTVKVTGRLDDAVAQIHGNYAGEEIDVAAIESGTNSKSGSIALPDSAAVAETERFRMNCKNLKNFTARVGGRWDGTGEKVRIDQVALELEIEGARR